jgi:hypothetical protein
MVEEVWRHAPGVEKQPADPQQTAQKPPAPSKPEWATREKGWDTATVRAEKQQQIAFYRQELEARYPGITQQPITAEPRRTKRQIRREKRVEREREEWRESDRYMYGVPPAENEEVAGDDRWVEHYAEDMVNLEPGRQLDFEPDTEEIYGVIDSEIKPRRQLSIPPYRPRRKKQG